jgi:[acyl-carrier-protein] S-malonyltransferase
MKHAFVFPGRDHSFREWVKNNMNKVFLLKSYLSRQMKILGFRISDIMFSGTEEDLKQTRVTQPAVFLHSVIAYKGIGSAKPDMVAGHSLGEFSALVANNTLSFEDALKLVFIKGTGNAESLRNSALNYGSCSCLR